MRHTPERHTDAADRTVKDIRRKTRKRYSSEDKIRIVLAGLRGEDTIAELCRQEGIAQSQYYSWSKEFLEAGKKRLAGDTTREANTGGVLGRFDGGLLSWRKSEKIQINGVVGSPVVSRKDLPFEDDVFFYGISIDYKPFDANLDTSWFFIDQRADGLIDRQAIGAEFRYFDETRSAFATIDYDIPFAELNTAIFSGNWTFADKSVMSLGLDYRKSPSLFTSNALQGQQLENLKDLLGVFNEDEIRRIALDRTATSQSATFGYSRPMNDMFQVNFDATWYNVQSTSASAGVDAILSTGDEYFYSAQILATNVVKQGDIFVAGVRYADRANSEFYTLDLNTRYPFTRQFRLNPRVRFTYRENKFDDGNELAVRPSIRLNYDYTRALSFEVEAGAKWSLREKGTILDEENEFFIVLGFRYDFQADERTGL